MPFDMPLDTATRDRRSARGLAAYASGLAGEEAVVRHFAKRGHDLVARRWRGSGGEIDLVFRDGEGLIFVEVKQAKHHAWAAERVSDAQVQRIFATGTEFCDTQPRGQWTDVRYDLALVDAMGRVEVIENAFAWL